MESKVIYYKPNPKFLELFGDINDMKRKFLAILVGNVLFSFGVNAFYTKHLFLSGGVGGISIMLQYITGISAGISVFILNLPLFLFGLRTLSKKFLIYTFISTIVQSVSMILFRGISQYVSFEDPLLSAIVGGAINGTAMGILFKNGCCQGGFDIVAAVMKKKYNMQIGSALMLLNAIVIGTGAYLFGLERAAYTIIAMFTSYRVLDNIQMNKGELKSVYIMSAKNEDIANAINQEMSRGVTFLKAEGGWSRRDTRVLFLVISNREIARFKNLINRIDEGAFMGISDLTEVRGRGFRRDDID